jgi:hypothetical protein
MEIKWHKQKMPTIKNQEFDLDTFLYSVICPTDKEINKHFYTILGNTDDIKFSLNNLLDFDYRCYPNPK